MVRQNRGVAGSENAWTVVVVDDHPRIRRLLVEIVDANPAFRVVGDAAGGARAVELCEELHPDLVLMDVLMAPVNGIEATRLIKERWPSTAVLALTSFAHTEWLVEMLRSGASGYLSKEAPPDELFEAMTAVLGQEDAYAFSPAILSLLGRYLHTSDASQSQRRTSMLEDPLTERELDLVRLLATGRSNREIASRMGVSDSAVKMSLSRITAKLGVRDRLQVAIRCHELGLVQLGLPDADSELS